MGQREQAIAKHAIRSGMPLPDRILNAPELRIGLSLYLQAFFDLDSERSHAMAPTPIPWTSILMYAQAFEFEEEQKEDLFYFVKALDLLHLKRLEEEQKRAQNTA